MMSSMRNPEHFLLLPRTILLLVYMHAYNITGTPFPENNYYQQYDGGP